MRLGELREFMLLTQSRSLSTAGRGYLVFFNIYFVADKEVEQFISNTLFGYKRDKSQEQPCGLQNLSINNVKSH